MLPAGIYPYQLLVFLFLLSESSHVYDFLLPIIRQYSCACFLSTSRFPAGTQSAWAEAAVMAGGFSVKFRARPVSSGLRQDLTVLINSRHCFFKKGQLAVQQLLSSAISSELSGSLVFSLYNLLVGFCVYPPCFILPHLTWPFLLFLP